MTGVELAFAACNLTATIFAAIAAWRSVRAAEDSVDAAKQSVLVAKASEKSAEKSAEAAAEQVEVSRMQKVLAQRQFIINLWDRMGTLKPVNPKDPAPHDVHAAVNTMELVGLCCEGGMIDVDVIKRTFKDRYVELYDMVKACGPIPTMGNKSGADLLRENRAAMSFYDELMKDIKGDGKLNKT